MSSYDITKTSLWADIKTILYSGKKPVKFEYTATLHTVKEDVDVLKLTNLDVSRDYVTNISDNIQVEFLMPLGEYMSRLYPYRTNLEFTIKRVELEETSGGKENNTNILTERFKAVFLVTENLNPAAGELDNYDKETLNKVKMLTIKLELLDRSIEPLRIKTISGVFRQVTPKQIIHNVMSGESLKVLVDGKPSIDGVDIVEPQNTEVKKHIILPSGINITNVPSYIQESMGGVYTAGLGTYLQRFNKKKLWFIYPLYDTNRFNTNVDKAIFYSIPKEKFPALDRTYNKDGKVLSILCTSDKQYRDSADVDVMNHGSGFRMSDATAFMKKPVNITEDGPEGSRTNLNYEVAAEDRKDGLNYAPVSSKNISSNPFTEYSKITTRSVGRLDLVWENSNNNLIYPGMPCEFVFLVDTKPVRLKGVILFIYSYTSLQGKGISANVYKSVSQLTLAMEPYKTNNT